MSTPGTGLAYLTDFGLDDQAERDLTGMLDGCKVIVGEASYRDADAATRTPRAVGRSGDERPMTPL